MGTLLCSLAERVRPGRSHAFVLFATGLLLAIRWLLMLTG